MLVDGDKYVIALVEAVAASCTETGSLDNWEDWVSGTDINTDLIKDIDAETQRKAFVLAELCSEADCFNEGFIHCNFGTDLELHMEKAEDWKGLEAVLEGFEGLGCTVSFMEE